jgi:segregation and condensation protein A
VRTFQQILERAKSRPLLELSEDSVTVGQMIDYLRRRLMLEERPLRLKHMLQPIRSRRALVCIFLALLELVRLQAIVLRQERLFGDILVKRSSTFDTVFGESGDPAPVNDDWK